MSNLELFFILFPVEYLKEVFIPGKNNLLKIQCNLDNSFGEFYVGSKWVYGS